MAASHIGFLLQFDPLFKDTEIRNSNIEIRNPDETEEGFIGQAVRAKVE